ncbi:MAG: methylmalonyl-CoA mutase, N-terminal domain, partial [Actinomycetota bacterium]
PENNVIRVTIQALAAVLGGTQSLHTNGFDEAIGLPTERAARIALRTQQIIANESGVVDTIDPLAGSYFVETLTDEVEARAWEYIEKIDSLGGAVAAIEAGYPMDEIEASAYEYTKAVDDQEKIIVGVNKYVDEVAEEPEVFPIDPAFQKAQADRVRTLKQGGDRRDNAEVAARLGDVRDAARGTQNLLHPMRAALKAKATLGEVSDALRDEFGLYQPSR